MNNLKKFATVTDYQSAQLNYPAVSWITATDGVHFDKAPVVINDKVMMAWHSPSDGKDVTLWNSAVSLPPTNLFNSLTVNDVDVMSDLTADATLHNYSEPNTDYLVKYELINDSTITDIFTGVLGGGWGSSINKVDFLVPSQVTEIQSIPNNVGNLVVEAATPPTTSLDWSSVGTIALYVPTESISAYQAAWELVEGCTILPISEYQGLLPV